MTRPPLLVNVSELLRHLGATSDVQRSVTLDGLAISTARVPPGATIDIEVTFESTASGAVAVHGNVRAPWEGECRRCLTTVRDDLSTDVQEIFEVRPTEGDTYPLVDDQVDLEQMVRDAALLALPLAPLCRDGCRGPDPDDFPVMVGSEDADDAHGSGEGVGEGRVDPRWAALDQLKDR